MRMCIIGLGLIGGSMALQLRKNGLVKQVYGVDSNTENGQRAKQLGIIDEVLDLDEGIRFADVIVIATPAPATVTLVKHVLNRVTTQLVFDVCSVKRQVCESIHDHPKRGNFVSTHPMAGTEYSGPDAATFGLFENKVVVLNELEKSDASAVKIVSEIYECLGMKIRKMDPIEHDMHCAFISHISHLSSMALALTVLDKEKDDKNIFDLASGGLDSTVRLAKSSSEMWSPIFTQNADNVLVVLENYIQQLNTFKTAIQARDEQQLSTLIKQANTIKKVIN